MAKKAQCIKFKKKDCNQLIKNLLITFTQLFLLSS